MVFAHVGVSSEIIDCLFANLEVEIRVPGKDLPTETSIFEVASGQKMADPLIPPPTEKAAVHNPAFNAEIRH